MSYGTAGSSTGAVRGDDGHQDTTGTRAPAATATDAAADHETTQREERGKQQTAWQRLQGFYERNFGLFLVFLAEIFASLVSATASHAALPI